VKKHDGQTKAEAPHTKKKETVKNSRQTEPGQSKTTQTKTTRADDTKTDSGQAQTASTPSAPASAPKARASTPEKQNGDQTHAAKSPAPAQAKTKAARSSPVETVTVSIIGLGGKPIVAATKTDYKSGETVLDATLAVAVAKNIVIDHVGDGAFAYVRGINGLYERDKGPKSGWLVMKNGQLLHRSAGAEKLKPGDVVKWFYTTDFTKAGGSGS
jgi:cytoskeletal protein RodZ